MDHSIHPQAGTADMPVTSRESRRERLYTHGRVRLGLGRRPAPGPASGCATRRPALLLVLGSSRSA
eukprot:2130466-Rhodomonas_salina.2